MLVSGRPGDEDLLGAIVSMRAIALCKESTRSFCFVSFVSSPDLGRTSVIPLDPTRPRIALSARLGRPLDPSQDFLHCCVLYSPSIRCPKHTRPTWDLGSGRFIPSDRHWCHRDSPGIHRRSHRLLLLSLLVVAIIILLIPL